MATPASGQAIPTVPATAPQQNQLSQANWQAQAQAQQTMQTMQQPTPTVAQAQLQQQQQQQQQQQAYMNYYTYPIYPSVLSSGQQQPQIQAPAPAQAQPFMPYAPYPPSPSGYYPQAGLPYSQMIAQSPRAATAVPAPQLPIQLQPRSLPQQLPGRYRRQSSATDPFMPLDPQTQQMQRQQGQQGQPPPPTLPHLQMPQQLPPMYSFPSMLPSPFFPSPMIQHHPQHHHHQQYHRHHMSSGSLSSTSSTTAVLPRGPPRKPKQSGHALWVGNLPLVTTVIDLRDMFASPEIESVFLISKSNCAFVNYSTDVAVREALDRFKQSGGILKGTKLVARMQRGSTTTDRAPVAHTESPEPQVAPGQRAHRPDAYYVVKSLTIEDLELSVKTGVWATQSHNERVLNEAYESTDDVYLIFSANKSGEYFGYARMAGPILADHAEGEKSEEEEEEEEPSASATVSAAESEGSSAPSSSATTTSSSVAGQPAQQPVEDLPKTTYTPATATSPAGRIIDDSSRGTIFWEVIPDSSATASIVPEPAEASETALKSWGTPFKVTWLSTNRVQFFKTKGLKNAWNANRDVKIARDGTELEPSVGRQLIRLFHGNMPIGPGDNMNPVVHGNDVINDQEETIARMMPTVVDSQTVNERE